jgi:hypothetical protein
MLTVRLFQQADSQFQDYGLLERLWEVFMVKTDLEVTLYWIALFLEELQVEVLANI